jgi:hypothetical protein
MLRATMYAGTSVVILHETIHEIHRKKKDGVLLKIILKRHMTKLIGPSFNRR